MELPLNERLHCWQNVSIDVVEKVERREQSQREKRPRSALHFYVRSLGAVFGRGQRASTVVPIPPRGRKTPRTTAHSGSAALTMSSSTRFTMFSWKIPRLR